jgi:hypothetical protein
LEIPVPPVCEMVTHKNAKKKNIRQEILNRWKDNGLKMKRWYKLRLVFFKALKFVELKKNLPSLTC